MKKILVIGSLNLDLVVEVDHTPKVGETILCDKMNMIPGGKGANQACAAGRLGANVSILGALGKDSYAEIQKDSLKKSKVNISRLITKENENTGLAFITVNKDGDNSIVVVSGANGSVSIEDIDNNTDLIMESDVVILQLEIPLPTVVYAARKAKKFGKTVILDPAPVPRKFPKELFEYADIIKPNETELSMLSGIEHAEKHLDEAIDKLRKDGARDIVITLGSKGAFVSTVAGEEYRIPAINVETVDTTAAGDAFTAAMAIMLAEGENLRGATEFANMVSAIVVTRKGAQSSIPNIEEVLAYSNSLKKEEVFVG